MAKTFTKFSEGTFRVHGSGRALPMGHLSGRWNAIEVLQGLVRKMPLAAQVGASIGLYKAGQHVLNIANAYFVPVARGTLVESGKVVEQGGSTQFLTKKDITGYPMTSLSTFSVTIEYGASHALFVHEDTTALHGKEFNAKYKGKPMWKKPSETAKFLEVAIDHADSGNMGISHILRRSMSESFRRILKNPGRYGLSGADASVTAVRQGMSIVKETGW